MEAYRAPRPWDYTSGLGNNNLLPEKMRSYELATSYYLSQNLLTQFSIYYNLLDGALKKENIGADYRWINSGEISTTGIEILLEHKIKDQKVSVNYTYNNSLDENKQIVPEIAKHSFNIDYNYSFKEYYKMNIRANYLGKRKNPQFITATQSDYTKEALLLHIVFSVLDYRNFDIQLMIKNILDTEYYHTSNRLPERYRQPQQTVMLKVGYHL